MEKILITGSNGFIAKNLKTRLIAAGNYEIFEFNRNSTKEQLKEYLKSVEVVFHLAGVNRPKNSKDFFRDNVDLLGEMFSIINENSLNPKFIFTSSTQSNNDSEYGLSKRLAEEMLENSSLSQSKKLKIYVLPGIYGKWSKPNYNSVVATFCYNVSRDKELQIDDENKLLELLYIDDLIDLFIEDLNEEFFEKMYVRKFQTSKIKLIDLANLIKSFHYGRSELLVGKVGDGLERTIYSTYLSFLPKEKFDYELKENKDPRGSFVECIKTQSSGQFSFFTINPGHTRGRHYHDTKTEKFMVIKGKAIFQQKDIISNEIYEKQLSDEKFEVVDSIPGYVHSINNIGDEELIVMIWANEIFNPNIPDTYKA